MRRAASFIAIVGIGTLATLGCGGSGNGSSSGNDAGSSGHDAGSSASCALHATCTAADPACVGLVSNAGQSTFGLRMSELDVTAPMALTSGLVATVIQGSVVLNLAACNQSGSATFSWLFQFDTQAMTLKTGGARPVADPTQGYSFDDEMITLGTSSFHVQPIVFSGVTPGATGQFTVATGADLFFPIFLDATGTHSIVLPLHQFRVVTGTLSSNNDCVGTYNAAGLDPTNSCQPDGTHPGFIDGGSLSGYIGLAEADTVVIANANESLCAVLAGPTNSTMNSSGVTVCSRDTSGHITYQGGWCSTSNAAATSTCADAESFAATFAASSVRILN